MANGRVRVGFSKPYVAEYTNTSGSVSYSNCMPLARGVSVDTSLSTSDKSDFWADNTIAESQTGKFAGGTITLTCDDPNPEAKALVKGTAKAGADGWVHENGDEKIPYVGIGFIVKYLSGGVESYVPVVIRKAQLSSMGDTAQTGQDTVNYTTIEQVYNLNRDDTTSHDWRWIHEEGFATESEAETAMKKVLGVTAA